VLQGYHPTFGRHQVGWEAGAHLELSPRQQMCYDDGKLFGGYLALLLDRIFAGCCLPAATAYPNTSVPPVRVVRESRRAQDLSGGLSSESRREDR
jgi:hypothetical protein